MLLLNTVRIFLVIATLDLSFFTISFLHLTVSLSLFVYLFSHIVY